MTMGDGGVYKNGKNHYFIMNMIKKIKYQAKKFAIKI